MMNELWAIPENWEWTEINALGQVVAGGTPSTKEPSFWGNEINWISPADLTGYTRKTISHGAKSITQKGLEKSSAKMMPAGSVHFSSRAPIGYVAISSEPLCTNQGFKSLVPAKGVFCEYIYYFLKSAKQLAEQRAAGTTFKEISGSAFGKLPAPLPPLNEQKRIVAKIEELFSELDKGIGNLKTARAQLKIYRQAVLKHAFEGKLTAQWREDNKDKLETADELLERIQKEREARHQQQLDDWKSSSTLAKPAKLDRLSKPSKGDVERFAALPNTWSYSPLGLLIDKPKYGTSKKCDYETSGHGVLRIPNVASGSIDDSDLKFAVFDEDEANIYKLEKGDILIIRSNGSISIVGKCAIISAHEENYLYAGYLIRLRPIKGVIYPEYLLALLSSHLLRNQIEAKAKSTSGVNNINSGEIQSIIVPICSLAEQSIIVEKLYAELSSLDSLEQEIQSSLEKAEALRQSILKKAFSGRLVAQDPTDEPASVLLERIKAEKNDKKKKKEKAA